MKSHVLIAGTGRAGTSFLVQLLTGCQLETGFNNIWDRFDKKTYSGMEISVFHKDWGKLPRIIKDPEISLRLDELLDQEFPIEHVIVPVRRLDKAAESRSRRGVPWRNHRFHKPYGTMENLLGYTLGKLTADLILRDVPHTFLKFPDLVENPEYLWKQLPWLFQDVSKELYDDIFQHLSEFAPEDSER